MRNPFRPAVNAIGDEASQPKSSCPRRRSWFLFGLVSGLLLAIIFATSPAIIAATSPQMMKVNLHAWIGLFVGTWG